nr:hypothetical protein [Desulforamulus aquiferis]
MAGTSADGGSGFSLNSTSEVSGSFGSGFVVRTACIDKFGNVFAAGYGSTTSQGRAQANDQSGISQTDTSFYTEYVVHGISADAYSARIAAEQAQASARGAKTSADTAATRHRQR